MGKKEASDTTVKYHFDDKDFCLLDEPWIRVTMDDFKREELSLIELFEKAPHVLCLSGETDTQNVAMLRFLLAVLITVLYRFDENGNETVPEDETDLMNRWDACWRRKEFDLDTIRSYLNTYRDRFWLRHPEHPFFQTSYRCKGEKDDTGTLYNIISLRGDIRESNNAATMAHFRMTSKSELGFSEAARWLIYYISYSASVKRPSKGSSGPCPLTLMTCIVVHGDTLFDTLLLNAMLLTKEGTLFGTPRPVWERPASSIPNRIVKEPDNLPELYTLQSRNVRFIREGQSITKAFVSKGDYCLARYLSSEPMTLWKSVEKKDQPLHFEYKGGDPSEQLWRNFPSMSVVSEDGQNTERSPGVINWLCLLRKYDYISNSYPIKIQSVGVTLDPNKSTITDSFSDSVTVQYGILSEAWRRLISNEVCNCKEVANRSMYLLALLVNSYMCSNKKKAETQANKDVVLLKQSFYEKIDSSFRDWLDSVNVEGDIDEERLEGWRKDVHRAAEEVCCDYMHTGREKAFTNYTKGSFYSIKEAFKASVNKYCPISREEE